MTLHYRANRHTKNAKFSATPRVGAQPQGEHLYGSFRYMIWQTKVGVTNKRETFSVRIVDEVGSPRQFLSGFSKGTSAHRAAQDWIDDQGEQRYRRDRQHRTPRRD